MKSRPRSVERELAGLLSDFCVGRGLSPIERIPVLGRTGPDLSINELNTAIDVKSRLEVPKGAMAFKHGALGMGDLILMRVVNVLRWLDNDWPPVDQRILPVGRSKMVFDWYEHMAEWAVPRGNFPAIILHRPRTRLANASLVISYDDLKKVKIKFQEVTNDK